MSAAARSTALGLNPTPGASFLPQLKKAHHLSGRDFRPMDGDLHDDDLGSELRRGISDFGRITNNSGTLGFRYS